MNEEVKNRIQRELGLISRNGDSAKLIEESKAVIYLKLPSTLGIIDLTDVLVLVPDGYPGTMLDYAFLPENSPLLNVVKGQPQDFIEVDNRKWQKVSYHPHNGGGGPPWNPTIHGFHTYIDELLAWLSIKR